MPRCPSCRASLPADPDRRGARCARCREPLYERPGLIARPPGPGEGQCALHPSNAAVGTCHRCGNYLCPVCRTRWRGQAVCVACVERALEVREQAPHEERAHLRQAVLALLFAIGAWAFLLAGVVLVGLGAALTQGNEGPGVVVVGLGVLVFLGSALLAVQGIGQGAAAIRVRGSHMILATAGLIVASLQVGLLIGLMCYGLWQN